MLFPFFQMRRAVLCVAGRRARESPGPEEADARLC